MQELTAGDGRRVLTYGHRLTALLNRALDLLPRSPPIGPVRYNPALVAFVGAVMSGAVALGVVSMRAPSDWLTLALGSVVALGEAAYAVRSPLPGVQAVWSPTVFVQLGLAVTLGPA